MKVRISLLLFHVIQEGHFNIILHKKKLKWKSVMLEWKKKKGIYLNVMSI